MLTSTVFFFLTPQSSTKSRGEPISLFPVSGEAQLVSLAPRETRACPLQWPVAGSRRIPAGADEEEEVAFRS